MGSRLLTKKEAAQVLGCSVRTVFYKIQRGELRPYSNGPMVCVSEEDVIALRDSKKKSDGERALPFAINRQTLLRHDTEIRTLRHELDQVLRVLNIRREPLRVSDIELVSLYKTATQYATEGWPPQIEETWASHFMRFQVHHLQALEGLTKDNHPWRPFLRLASTMALRPYNTELSLQLVSGRESLQSLTTVWFEINRLSPRQLDAMLMKEGKPGKRLLGVIERRQQKLAAKLG
jgi:excisionase family DNA binding protein